MVTAGYGSVIAHRGYSGEAPENTLAAFEAAIVAGCDLIELDARVTGDGRAVVLHDDELLRYWHDGRASERTLVELQELDAGSWFGGEFAGERFLGLTEALVAIAARVPVNVELKLDGEDNDGQRVDELITAVIADVEEARRRLPDALPWPPFLYSTFSDAVFAELRRRAPETPAALLVGYQLGPRRGGSRVPALPLFKRISYLFGTIIPRLIDQGAEGLHLHRSLASAEVIGVAHDAGLAARVFTVNRVGDARRLLALGCDGLFTDQVERVIEVVAEQRGR